jgi:TRAP-type C4-dicarboxylate transport system substrate-binding protein
MIQTKKITWVIAHDPAYLFLRAAEYFRAELEKHVPGQIEIEVLTQTDYAEKYNNGQPISKKDVLDLMESGKIQVSQLYTTWLADRYTRNLNVIDLPFLFKDHDHASRVFDGEIGRELLGKIESEGGDKIKALAFTYSGGYRCIPSKSVINSIDDFKGVKFRVSSGPVIKDTFDMLGADTVFFPVEELAERAGDNEVDAGECTYTRYYPLNQDKVLPIISDMEHNISCTCIIINKEFWNTLTIEQQEAMQIAGRASARIERVESVNDAIRVEKECRDNGVEVVKWEDHEITRFKEAMEPVYDKYTEYFPDNLVNRIKNA